MYLINFANNIRMLTMKLNKIRVIKQ